MTDEKFEELSQQIWLGYDHWGDELKEASKMWRTKHQAAYFAFEYRRLHYLRRQVFDVIFSDLSDEQKLLELEKILPHNGSIYL